MSASPEESEDAVKGELPNEELTDSLDLPAAGGDGSEAMSAVADEDYVPDTDHEDDGEDHRISEMLEEGVEQDVARPAGDTGLVNRYRQLVQEEQDAASDSGSADAVPRRASSPVDSSLSIPDDTPSVQVCLSS